MNILCYNPTTEHIKHFCNKEGNYLCNKRKPKTKSKVVTSKFELNCKICLKIINAKKINCFYCKKETKITNYFLTHFKYHFCSKKCRNMFRKTINYDKYIWRLDIKEVQKKQSIAKEGEKNPMWKGDKVGYTALHYWINQYKPKPEVCVRCHQRPAYDLANISGQYKRDVNDYEWLCRRCHMFEDGRIKNLKYYKNISDYNA